MKKTVLATTVLVPLSVSAVQAQSVDYNALEDLFGEPVTTSATGKPQRASEAPASMTIISGDQLVRSGATTIPDILQNYAGIDVNRYATMQREVTIRGANMPYSPRLLVLVNGRQVFLDHYGYTDWTLTGVEFEDIQQIEVVRGPQSALFGFNAVAGVVHIITQDPLSDTGMSGRIEAGSHDTYVGSLVGRFKLNDRLGLKVSGGYHEADEWDDIAPVSHPAHRQNVSGELSAQITDKMRGTLSYTHADNRLMQQAYSYGLIDAEAEMHSVNSTVSAETGIGLVKGQATFNKFEQRTATLSVRNKVYTAKAEDLFKIGTDHTFRVAGEFRRNEYEFNDNSAGTVFYNVYAGSGMWEWALTNKLTLTNAARIDRLRGV